VPEILAPYLSSPLSDGLAAVLSRRIRVAELVISGAARTEEVEHKEHPQTVEPPTPPPPYTRRNISRNELLVFIFSLFSRIALFLSHTQENLIALPYNKDVHYTHMFISEIVSVFEDTPCRTPSSDIT
jgi:hypothetical protein